MGLNAGDIERLHASFGSVDELLSRRRAIYRLSGELAGAGPELAQDDVVDVVDNPAVRAHLGEVLAAIVAYDGLQVHSLDRLVAADGHAEVHGHPVRLASSPQAAVELQRALGIVDAELARRRDRSGTTALVLKTSKSFAFVKQTVTDGVRLAVEVGPELAPDLLPHVALFAVLNATSSGRLGSASVREFPGLVVLPEPRSPLEVAEALVHEGAHQKFFDLVLTCSILGPHTAALYAPPWSADDAPAWPFEQCVAAFHAYCCLDAFAGKVAECGIPLHAGSLLPVAADRARILGEHLLGKGALLGPDGQRLVGELAGGKFDVRAATIGADDLLTQLATSPHQVGIRECGEWTLLIEWTRPADVLWAPTAAVTPRLAPPAAVTDRAATIRRTGTAPRRFDARTGTSETIRGSERSVHAW